VLSVSVWTIVRHNALIGEPFAHVVSLPFAVSRWLERRCTQSNIFSKTIPHQCPLQDERSLDRQAITLSQNR
jgi:hypothetical protein